MKKLLTLLALSLVITACAQKEEGKPSTKEDVKQIGIIQLMEHPSLNEITKAFVDEMQEIGYGEDVCSINIYNGQNDITLMTQAANKLKGENIDLIVTVATPAAQAAASVTDSIPILFSAVTDPIAAGLTESIDAPNKNITGTSDKIPTKEILNLALTITPNIKTIGIIYNNAEANSQSVVADMKKALEEKGIDCKEAIISSSGEATIAINSLVGKVDAIFLPIDNTVAVSMPTLSSIAIKEKLPLYVSADSMVNDGGLATVGINYTGLGKQTAHMAKRILEGEEIKSIPIEVMDKYETVVNEETAKALGLDVSQYIK